MRLLKARARGALETVIAAVLAFSIVVPFNAAALIVDNLQFAAPPTVTGTCQYPDTILWLYDNTSGGNLADYECWNGVSKMIFDYHVGDNYTLVEMTADGDCSEEDIAGCRALPSYRGEASFTVGTTDIPGPSGSNSSSDDPANAPSDAGPLWINHASYHPNQNIGAVCAAGGNYLTLYDLSTGENLGVFPCGTVPFNGISGHSYLIIEITNQSACESQAYDTCEASGSGVAEISFPVTITGGTDAGVSSARAQISKSAYLPGENVLMTCTFTHNSLGLFNADTNENLGIFPCDSPISFDGQDGQEYSLIELTNSSACVDQAYDTCVASGYGISVTNFFVSSSGDVPNGTPSGIPGTNKQSYKPGESVLVTCTFPGNSVVLYDQDTNDNLGSFSCSSPINFESQDGHSYRLLEVNNASACTGQRFDTCYASGYASLVYDFNVAGEKEILTRGLSSYRPEVTVSSPKAGAVFSHGGRISYKATDRNDLGSADEKARLGLIQNPVSLYYTDKIDDWDHTITPVEDMTPVAANQPASGTYQWDTTGLLPGVFYRAVATAIDATGNVGEDVSDPFTVDFEQPTFTVSADPPVTRSQSVTITVVASKDLKGTPTTTVTQQGAAPKQVAMKGAGREFTGTYAVIPGHDGIATITVEGADAVGNAGDTIVSGGTFAVGIDPPPAPHIISPSKGAVAASSSVTLAGTTRPDTSVILKVNGAVQSTIRPDSKGNFSVPVALSATTRRGINTLSVAAKDQAGVTGAEASVEVKYNIAPVVHMANPQNESVLGASVAIEATSSDANLDPLLFTYQIIDKAQFEQNARALAAGSGASSTADTGWTTVAERVPSSRFNWDSTEVDDGSYYVRIIADDGTTRVASEARLITIKNTLPYFRFEDGRKTITGTSTVLVRGRVIVPQALSPRPVIWNADYSLDNGTKWIPIKFTSGSSTPEASFAVLIRGLKQGTQGVLWRVRDSRELTGKASHPIIFDTTPPKAPAVVSPRVGGVIGDSDDSSPRKGMQVSITGRAEPQTSVALAFAGSTLSAKAAPDGSFSFNGIDVPARGSYQASLTASDEAGNTSKPSIASFTYDNAPQVAILQPKNLRALNGVSEIRWRASDPDNDPLAGVRLSYRSGSGAFVPLPIKQATSTFRWNLSGFPEGHSYQLRLEAGDGIATSSDTVEFSIDRTPPDIGDLQLSAQLLGASGHIKASGSASDALSGIEYVEYAIADREADPSKLQWYTALITRGFLGKKASFSIDHPVTLDDGSYSLYVRSVDAAGNTSAIESRDLTVDTSPPHIGAFELKAAGQSVAPDDDGTIDAYEHGSAAFSISLEGDAATSTLFIGERAIPLAKDISTGLWRADLQTDAAGSAPLSVSAQDGAGNAVIKTHIGRLETIGRGTVFSQDGNATTSLGGASLQVLVLDQSGTYVPLSAPGFEQGAHSTDEQGTYELALPQGTYRIVVRKDGYATVQADIALKRPGLVAQSLTTRPLSAIGSIIQSVTEFFGQ